MLSRLSFQGTFGITRYDDQDHKNPAPEDIRMVLADIPPDSFQIYQVDDTHYPYDYKEPTVIAVQDPTVETTIFQRLLALRQQNNAIHFQYGSQNFRAGIPYNTDHTPRTLATLRPVHPSA